MKKVILALAIVSVSFAACNNGETKTEEKPSDTMTVVTPKMDTTTMVKDTTIKTTVIDTTKK